MAVLLVGPARERVDGTGLRLALQTAGRAEPVRPEGDIASDVLARTKLRRLWAVGLLGPVSAGLVGAAFVANSLN